jgi:hypothetical protein
MLTLTIDDNDNSESQCNVSASVDLFIFQWCIEGSTLLTFLFFLTAKDMRLARRIRRDDVYSLTSKG